MPALDDALNAILATLGRTGTLVFAAIGIIWVAYTFLWSNTRHPANKYYEERLRLCVDASKTAAQIATATDPEVLRKAVARFEELYWGELVITEDPTLETAMVNLRGNFTSPTRPLTVGSIPIPQRYQDRVAAIGVGKACHDLVQPTIAAQIASWFRSNQKAPTR